jgi:hypothetical protein
MKRNRKKVETYRFNGNPFLHAHSIHSVTIARLELGIKDLESKLANPNDPDDKEWVQRWLMRFKKELAKKRKGLALKESERCKRRKRGR